MYNNSIIKTVTKPPNNSANGSFGFTSSKSTTTTCRICNRLLYDFEEILTCQLCHGSFHWRCVKPETISHYGESSHFVCDICNGGLGTTTIISNRLTNGSTRIKSLNGFEINDKDIAGLSSKSTVIPTKDVNAAKTVHYYNGEQENQPSHTIVQYSESRTSPVNGQFTDDKKTNSQHQERQNHTESDEDTVTTTMFQANYQYTPLKEFAALRNAPDNEQQQSSPYDSVGNIRYVDQEYDSTKPRTVKSPTRIVISCRSPVANHEATPNRPQHFISTTNLSVSDPSSHQQQGLYTTKQCFAYSTPYLSQVYDDEASPYRTYQNHQYAERNSAVGSDSGIVVLPFNNQYTASDDNQQLNKKLTDLVQQLGRQLETDAQKLSEKLEQKLKNLEYMINQQTFVIREQDEVIERLKSKIHKIEDERDNFRERLSAHEQREREDRKNANSADTDKSTYYKPSEPDDEQYTLNDVSTHRKSSNSSSTTENTRRANKKQPAPKLDPHGQKPHDEKKSAITELISKNPTNPERHVAVSTTAALLAASEPLTDKPTAANLLDNMIHHSGINELPSLNDLYYNVHNGRDGNDPKQYVNKNANAQDNDSLNNEAIQSKSHSKPLHTRSTRSDSFSTASSAGMSINAETNDLSRNAHTLPTKSSAIHQSLEFPSYKPSDAEDKLRSNNKAASLEITQKPVSSSTTNSLPAISNQANLPAIQYQTDVKGWLEKQNRASFWKRVERYYCVLHHNSIFMHKTEQDRHASKIINLNGASVNAYEDPKYGPALQLTWRGPSNRVKTYHLYFNIKRNVQIWLTGIQTAIQNIAEENNWKKY